MADNPHLATSPLLVGAPLDGAAAAAVLVHGRDHGAAEMLDLVRRLALDDVAYLIPLAARRSWYPGRLFEPTSVNEPWLGFALDAYEATVRQAMAAGVAPERIVVAGFSQGACVTAEFVARRPRRYGGVALLTGGLIGTDDELTTPGPGLEGIPMFVATSTLDTWVPTARVEETVRIFAAAGADITFSVDDDPEHHINDDAVQGTRSLIVRACAPRTRPS